MNVYLITIIIALNFGFYYLTDWLIERNLPKPERHQTLINLSPSPIIRGLFCVAFSAFIYNSNLLQNLSKPFSMESHFFLILIPILLTLLAIIRGYTVSFLR